MTRISSLSWSVEPGLNIPQDSSIFIGSRNFPIFVMWMKNSTILIPCSSSQLIDLTNSSISDFEGYQLFLTKNKRDQESVFRPWTFDDPQPTYALRSPDAGHVKIRLGLENNHAFSQPLNNPSFSQIVRPKVFVSVSEKATRSSFVIIPS